MATYKEVKGVTVQTKDEDPVVGGVAGASWSSGGSLNTARYGAGAAGADNTAALVFGGTTNSVLTELYNGSSFTEVNDLNSDRQFMGGQGTSTAAIGFGGEEPGITGKTELWNGTNWTEVNDMNTARYTLGSGTLAYTEGFCVGGWLLPGVSSAVEAFDGTNWTEVAEMNTARNGPYLSGDSSNAICSGGSVEPGVQTKAELWNGSSWTETGDLNTARYNGGSAGTYTDALVYAGMNQGGTKDAETEAWNGSVWTEVADLSPARRYQHGAGAANTNAIYAGGFTTTTVANTEEWAAAPPTADILTEGSIFLSGGTTLKAFGKAAGIPAATWASGGNMNVSSHARGGAGHLNTAALAIGADPSPQGQTELYNGTSWTELNDLNVGRRYAATLGTTTLALAGGGANPGGYSAKAETWDGTNWTAITDINSTRGYFSGAGLYNSAIILGGEPTDNDAKVEIWDGSSWTEVSDLNTGVRQFARAGHSSANDALKAGGYTGTAHTADTETWDGSSWTEVSNLNTSRYSLAGDGASSGSALAFGGYTSTNVANTESWNGSSWTEVNDLGTARNNLGGAGASVSGLAFGANPASAATEEFTADSALSDVTVS